MALVGVLQFRAGVDLVELVVNRIPGLHGNADLVTIQDRAGFRRPAGTATHPIEFGCVIAMALPLAAHLARFDTTRPALRRWTILGMIAIGIPVAVSRSAVLGALVATLVVLVGLEPRLRPRALATVLAFVTLTYVTTPGLLGALRDLFVHARQDTSITYRTDDYEVVAQYVQQAPWLGRGPGTFLPRNYLFLDNQYLLSVVEVGLVGLAVVIAYLLASAFLGRGARHRSADPSIRDLGQAVAATTLAAAATAATFDAFSFLMFAGVVPLVLGLAGALWGMTRVVRGRPAAGPQPAIGRNGASPPATSPTFPTPRPSSRFRWLPWPPALASHLTSGERPAPARRHLAGSLALAVGMTAGVAACTDDPSNEPAPAPTGVTLREVEGSYPTGLPNDPAFFPLGVWLASAESASDVDRDRALGLNLYAGLVRDPPPDLDAVERSGMHLLVQADEWSGQDDAGHAAVDGWLVHDEADLTYGPGWDDWSGTPGWNTCVPPQDDGGQCGYTVMRHHEEQVPAGALRYANYGLGVLRFESDDEAEVFVNGGFQDVVSADDYSFTHPGGDLASRQGASYGATVRRIIELDQLDGERQPVWAFVEVGHPFTEDDAPTITAAQMRSAVWHSIIAGARGIVYFNHSFGGPCQTDNVLRTGCDPDMAPAVTEVNRRITELAPVLNAPFADGYVEADGPAEVMAKRGPDGAWYVFAAASTAGGEGGDVTFRVAAGSRVDVLHEGRHLDVRDGRFTDRFADGNAVHIYRIT